MSGDIYDHSAIAASLKRVGERLARVRACDGVLTRDKDQPLVHTRLQAVFNTKHPTVPDRVVHEVLMTHALRAEKLGPGGFDRCIELVLERLGAPGGQRATVQGLPNPVTPTVDDVGQIVRSNTRRLGARLPAMLARALELAGHGGRIIIEKSLSQVPSVELVRGYTFELQQLLPIDASFIHPRVFCIDGFIEEVSEVHHVLEAAAEAREPCVVFVRGASNDVKHTLKVNYDRGSLRVLPIGVRFDLDGMNTLVDLSVVAGCDLVSSLKGDLISSIRFHDAPRVDQVSTYRDRVVITHAATHANVATHVGNLRKRRQEEQLDDKGTLLDRRVKSLSPNHVVIRLPDDKDFVVHAQALDHTLRAVKSAVDYGVTGPGRELVSTELAARVHADRCVKTLLELGACLT